jgi:hypothetical protein
MSAPLSLSKGWKARDLTSQSLKRTAQVDSLLSVHLPALSTLLLLDLLGVRLETELICVRYGYRISFDDLHRQRRL